MTSRTFFRLSWVACMALTGCTGGVALALQPDRAVSPVMAAPLQLPRTAVQGSLVTGRAPAGSTVEVGGRVLKVGADGNFVFALARDAGPVQHVSVKPEGQARVDVDIAVSPRDWPIEHINGVPPATVNPPPAIAERIRVEQARVASVRTRDDPRLDYLQKFDWPVRGRISGRFGNQRVYNGSAGAPHSGMDIAAAQGTPVHAPAAGIVTFADPSLYLTGGTVVLDHGHGVSSNFLHLSRIDVRVGERVEQGGLLGAVGATGRATGPHLHWGINWFDVRVDPLLVLDRAPGG